MAESVELRSKHTRAGKAMAVATFSMAAGSGLQALLYLRAFGVNSRTDGFFAAFALYAIFGVFSQSLRITSAPLLVGARPRIGIGLFAAALAVIAVPVAVLTGPLAGELGRVLAPSGTAVSRSVTVSALPILGGAMILQLWAAGGATVLAVADRFRAIASAYAGGAGAGLVGYLALEPVAHEQVLGYSMLIMAAGTFALMLVPTHASWRLQRASAAKPASEGSAASRLVRCVGSLLGRTGIYLTFNALYLVTLAFAGGYGTGDATIVSYAYLFCSYLVAGTGFALGMARVADMTRGATAGEELVGTVPQGYRYAILISAPALAGLVAAGAPLIGTVLPSSLSGAHVVLLQRIALLMAPWLIAAQLVNLLLPLAFARGRSRAVNALAPLLLIAQLAFTAAGALLFDLYGAVAAMCVAPALFAATMLVASCRGDRRRRLLGELARDTARFGTLAAASFGAAWLLTRALPSSPARPALVGLLGTAGYLAGLLLFAGDQVARLVGRPAAARRRALPRIRVRGWAAVALLVALGAASMARQWNGHIYWATDGLFYQAKVLEIRGESPAHALHQVFDGPLGVWSRETLAQTPGDTSKLQASAAWPAYSERFYSRRLALPYAAAALYPLLGLRSLQFLSLLGYVALGPLLYALLRRRFSPGASLIAAALCMVIPSVREWAVFPMADSWGLSLEVAALLTAVLTLERGMRWLPGWIAAVLLLSITRDTAFVAVAAAGVLFLLTRTRASAALTLTGFLAFLPAPLLDPVRENQQLAYVFANHTIPVNSSWSHVLGQYLPNFGHMLSRDLTYAVHNPLNTIMFTVGIVLLLAWAPRREPWFVLVKGAALGYLLLLVVGPSFSEFRYELVLVPLVAGGLALGAERALIAAERLRAARLAPAVPEVAGTVSPPDRPHRADRPAFWRG